MVNMQSMSEQDKKKTCNHEICLKCCSCLTEFVLDVGIATWIVFSVIALINETDNEVRSACSDSNLWQCMCCITAFTGFNLLVSMYKSSENTKGSTLAVCFTLAGFIWMATELFQPCSMDNLQSFQLWKLLVAMFALEAFVLGMLLLGGCGFCIVQVCCLKTIEKNDTQEEFV
jgi:hypothetical protein